MPPELCPSCDQGSYALRLGTLRRSDNLVRLQLRKGQPILRLAPRMSVPNNKAHVTQCASRFRSLAQSVPHTVRVYVAQCSLSFQCVPLRSCLTHSLGQKPSAFDDSIVVSGRGYTTLSCTFVELRATHVRPTGPQHVATLPVAFRSPHGRGRWEGWENVVRVPSGLSFAYSAQRRPSPPIAICLLPVSRLSPAPRL